MFWFWLGIVYVFLVVILTIEASHHQLKWHHMFLVSFLLTPLTGLIVLIIYSRRPRFHHYVKLQNGSLRDKNLGKTLKTNGKQKWIEIKSSEIKTI